MTRKMMGVIYRAFREGKLRKTTKEDINKAYSCVDRLNDYDFRTFHRDAYACTMGLKDAVDAIFAGDYEKADALVWGFAAVPVA